MITQADELQQGDWGSVLAQHLPSAFYSNKNIKNELPSYDSQNPYSPTGSEVINAINDDFYGLWWVYNHGTPKTMAMATQGINQSGGFNYVITPLDNDAYGSESYNGLDNLLNKENPMITYSTGCINAPFDKWDPGNNGWGTGYNLAESFTIAGDYGGPAFLGYTRYGTGGVYEVAQNFADMLNDENTTSIGQAEWISKPNQADHYKKLSHNVIGCPETRIWTAIPSSFSNVTITDNGSSIAINTGGISANITVCSLNNGASYFSSVENSSITFLTAVRPLYVTITKTNYLPFVGITGGTITSNALFTGLLKVTGDLTISSGVTLTIDQGAQLFFSPNRQLVVNGTLNVQGNSSNMVIFNRNGSTGNWAGIRFNNGSNGSINYANIQYSTWGIFFNNLGNNSISVTNSYIQNNSSYGIWSSNSSLTSIQNNHILNNGSYGIYCDSYSSPYIYYNMIKGSSVAGIYSTYYSQPRASTTGGAGSNIIKDNSGCGLYANYNSILHFGDETSYAYNSIYNNTSYEVKSENSSIVWAQNNYWGSSPGFSGSTIYNQDMLAYDPNAARPRMVGIAGNTINTAGIILKVNGNTGEIKSIASSEIEKNDLKNWKDIFTKEWNTPQGRYALIKIEECYSKENEMGFEDFVNQEIFSRKDVKDELTVMGLELINHSLLTKGDFKGAVNNLEKIKKELLLNEAVEKNTLYELGSIYLNSLNDNESAIKYFEKLKQKYPEDILTYNGEVLLGNNPSIKKYNVRYVEDGGSYQADNETQASFQLLYNYPNPFNPVTTISYTLPEAGNVQIKIFDVLGREIVKLVDEEKSAGKYSVAWNGSNYASGIYFYTITFNDQTLKKKMLMIK